MTQTTAPRYTAADMDPYFDRITAAYQRLAVEPGNLVRLTDLRDLVGGYRQLVDAALRHMSRTRRVNLIPESNQKTLTAADRTAAVVIGDQPNHLISIPRPA